MIITDIESDVEDTDAQLGLVSGLASETRAPVIANGIVRGIDDISRLKYVPSVSGVMVGRALFRKIFDLKDALAVARPATGRRFAPGGLVLGQLLVDRLGTGGIRTMDVPLKRAGVVL